MDLQISVFLLFILFTAGHSLSCYECSGQKGSCANQKVKTCPRGFSKCMSTTAVTQVGDSLKVKVKDCAADCASGSMNLGIVKRSSVCCNTDRCNVRDAPDPSIDSNGKKCYSCDGKNCSNTVSCSGSEDHCITSVGHSLMCYECVDLMGSCANQNATTCPIGSTSCMSITTVTEVGKSSMIY
uniref:Lymphocyte antigen 6 family member M5 n=1 Tax=Cyprinus carpio TaxID=7962 RepID=A0A8C1YGG5_CYPCA